MSTAEIFYLRTLRQRWKLWQRLAVVRLSQATSIAEAPGQPLVVRPAIDDIQVEGGDRHALEDGGDATYDDELDFMPNQDVENVEEPELVVHFLAL